MASPSADERPLMRRALDYLLHGDTPVAVLERITGLQDGLSHSVVARTAAGHRLADLAMTETARSLTKVERQLRSDALRAYQMHDQLVGTTIEELKPLLEVRDRAGGSSRWLFTTVVASAALLGQVARWAVEIFR